MYLSPKPGRRKGTTWLRSRKFSNEYKASKENEPAPSKEAVFAAKAAASPAPEPQPGVEPSKGGLVLFLRKHIFRF